MTTTIDGAARPVVTARATRHTTALLVGAGLLAALAFLTLYPRVGLDADSVAYVGVGRNIAHGHGVTYPFKTPGARMTDFPPGYPLLLGTFDAIGMPIVGFAQVLQACMLGIAAALAAALVLQAARSRLLAVTAFLLVAGAAGLHQVFSVVYTEPLAIALQLAALSLLARYAAAPRPQHQRA